MIYCNFRTSSEIHPNTKRYNFFMKEWESFEHRITAGGWGQSGRKMLWQHDQMKLKNTGCIQDDSQNFKGNKTELSTDEFLLFFFPNQ